MCIRSPWSCNAFWYVMSLFGQYDVTCDLRWLSCSVIAMSLSLPLAGSISDSRCANRFPSTITIFLLFILLFLSSLRAPVVASKPNLQVVVTHASHICMQHSFGLPLRMNGMHIMQCDHARLDLLPLVIWSRVFWPPLTWNLIKAQRWSKSVVTFDRSRPHSVTFCFF